MSYSCLQEPWDFLGGILEQLEGEVDESVVEFCEEEIDEKTGKIEEKIEEYLEKAGKKCYSVEPIGVLWGILRMLLQATTAGADQNKTQEKILDETAEMMKKYLESTDEMGSCRIGVEHPQYVAILQELLPSGASTSTWDSIPNNLAGEDHVVKKIKDITLKIHVELLPVSLHQQDKSMEESVKEQLLREDCRERIEQVLVRIKEYLLIQETTWRDEKINPTRLVRRWVAEKLTTGQDWSSSVNQAEHCFDVLTDLRLLCARDVDAAGNVKSITVHPLVYNFITKMARKEHILDTRLSRHLARHFSILSNIQLRPSDSILDFLKQPSRASSRSKLGKVLDLEGCTSLRDNQRWLRNVCTSFILLKYLSLRNTDVTRLPKEINRLQQLEVLDIRKTPMNASAIKKLMLLKLKRLLASLWGTGDGGDAHIFSTLQMPRKVKTMTDLEVLSHIQASKHHATELRDIGQLSQLRVLGVVIYDWKAQIENLLQGISDLNECLRSLSIDIKPPPSSKAATPPDMPATDAINAYCKNPPKLLESLSITGDTMYGRLLQLFTRDCDNLAKVTLCNTSLDQDDMQSLADLPNLRGLRLRHVNLHTEGKLVIQTKGFQKLKYLVVEGGSITNIDFEPGLGEAPRLEKIVWLIDGIESLSGIENLPNLKEMVFNDGARLPDQVKETIEAHPNFIDNNGIWN
ncbi:hypothetical protein ZWY2020_015298 [Hordeum vulgare]|nr:hypothetical protein ZWY2020_015298 [Hordeum vulgare]